MLTLLFARIALAACPDDPEACPRCLDVAVPGGLYALADDTDADPMLARPVAVVAGCVGTVAGDAWNHGVQVVPPDGFAATDWDGHRCASGTTADYRATATGLSAVVHVWTNCGGGLTHEHAPVELVLVESIEPIDSEGLVAAFEHGSPAVRAAALEAIARRQPEEWTCEPLGRAVRGGLGSEAMGRGVALADQGCLAADLRVTLFDHHWSPAADALARLEPSDAVVAEDLVRAAVEGVNGAPRALAERLAAAGPVDPDVREALVAVLLARGGNSQARQASSEALDRLFREGADGRAMIKKGDRGGSCDGWRILLDTVAVKASGYYPPRAVAKRCDLGEPLPYY